MDLSIVQLTLDQLLEASPAPIEAPVEPSAAELLAEMRAALKFLDGLAADERYYLRGPIVYHPGSDAGPLLPKYIPQARLDLVLSGEKELATLEEALAYLSSASLCFPLSSEDAEVMFWLTQEVWEKHKLTRGDQKIWEMLGRDEPFTLTPYQEKEVLNSLRRKIRAAVVRHSKKRRGPRTRKSPSVSPLWTK
jgi:hypothetical protein